MALADRKMGELGNGHIGGFRMAPHSVGHSDDSGHGEIVTAAALGGGT
jgi:hypothetical protein